ncbi:MAG TPA: SurA N-terminal domain-containing protein [Candidatus Saccharimonadia bacterium]|nr:SurA N-terminal domain-containing protein [Candidatus Saccharimonadia bacterium]
MLQKLREKTSGWLAFVILAAVSIPFAFFGINNYFETRTETFVAKVDEAEITPSEFRVRFERYRDQVRQMQGDAFDAEYFEQATVKREMLDAMIDEEVLAQAAARSGTLVSDERLREEIAKIPAFQGMDGKFDQGQYRQRLAGQNESPASFEERVRRDLSLRELPSQLAASALVSDAELDRFVTLRDQKRDFRYALVPRQAAEVEPTDVEIAAYHESHKDEFMTPEQVALEYIEVDASKLDAPPALDEESLKQRYEEQKSRFGQAEQRTASHILVKVDANADAAAQKLAQAKAAALAEEARGGKDFAVLAGASSDDLGSKSQGGDLGAIERGTMQPAFEEALFAMQPDAISDPVRTDEGYHVIKLREITPEKIRPFDEVRVELEKEYVDGEREREFLEISGELIDKVYEDPNALAPAAEAMKLELKRTPLFGREGGEGIAANPAVIRAAFSDRVLVEGGISDAIEIGPNHLVVVRAEEHKPRVVRPLEEVRDEIVARLKDEASATRTEALAKDLRTQLDSGAPFDEVAAKAAATVETADGIGRTALNLDAALIAKAFALPRPAAGKPTRSVVELRKGDYALVELSAVVDGEPSKLTAEERTRARTELQQGVAAVEGRSMLGALRAASEVQVAEDRM